MRVFLTLVALLVLGLGLWFGKEELGSLFDAAPTEHVRETPTLLTSDEAEVEPAGLAGRGHRASDAGAVATAVPPAPVDLDAASKRGDLHGTVVRPDGSPLAGASLQIVRHPWRRASVLASGRWNEERLGEETLSARDGTFALPLRPGLLVSLRASCAGCAAVERTGCRAGVRVRFTLAPGLSLQVFAENPEGKRLVGVTLELTGSGATNDFRLRRTGTTGAQGGYRFEDLPAGFGWSLKANHGHLGGYTWGEPVPDLPETGDATHTVEIKPGRVVRGAVTDAATGRPLAGALVGMGWTFHKQTKTDAEGRYALGGWTGDGYHEIHVLADGYGRAEKSVGSATTVDLALVRGFSVRGRIRDARGSGIAGARLSVVGTSFRDKGGQAISTAHGQTGEDGAFDLPGLRPDMPHTLVVMADGFGRHLTEFEAPPKPGRLLDLGEIVLPRGIDLAGRVRNADGSARSRVGISITGANDDAGRRRPRGAEPLDGHYGRQEERTTDEAGTFAFADLSPGTYLLQAGRHGDNVTASVTLRAGSAPAPITLRFKPSHLFTALVVDEMGAPVEEIFVDVEPEGGERTYGETNEDGRISFRLPLHVRWVSVRTTGFIGDPKVAYLEPGPQRVAVSEVPHRIVLRHAAVVRGRLLGPEGRPLDDRAIVLAQRDGKGVGSATTDPKGAFQLEVPPGGSVDVLFRGDVWRNSTRSNYQRVRLALEAGQKGVKTDGAPITLRAHATSRDASIDVFVTTLDDSPIQGAIVEVLPSPLPKPLRATTDEKGRVSFRALTAQPVTITVKPPEARADRLAPQTRKNMLPQGQTLRLRLLPPLILEGTVVDGDGNAVVGADVHARGDFPGHSLRAKTDEEGRFRLAFPPDMDGRLNIWAAIRGKDGVFQYADVSGIDPHKGPLRLEVRPRSGW